MTKLKSVIMGLVGAVVFSPAWVPAQIVGQPVLNDDLPYYYLDMVNVRGNKAEQSRLQIYVKIPYDELSFTRTESDSFKASYEISVVLFDEQNFQADGKIWQERLEVSTFDSTNLKNKYSFTSAFFDLDPGKYKVVVGLMDLDTKQTKTLKTTMELRDYKTPPLSISDILLADSVSLDSLTGTIIPHPRVNVPRLQARSLYGFFYLYTDKNYGPFDVEVIVRNARNKKVFQDSRDLPRTGGTTPIAIAIADSQLSHGSYSMHIRVKAGRNRVELEKSFAVQWQGVPVTAADLVSAIAQLKYIGHEREIKKINDTPTDSQVVAFKDFWKRRDPTPGTDENELMDEYYRRVQYANTHFGNFRDGWKTDMGMVYIILGPPSDVERNPFNSTYTLSFSGRPIKAWEIWHYYEINRYFVFVDDTGFGEYKLDNPYALQDLTRGIRY